MKHLLTIISCLTVLSMCAQSNFADDWNPDADGDNNVGVSDLLALLTVFGENDIDEDGIWDSMDDCIDPNNDCVYGCANPFAENFSPFVTVDDGSCEFESMNSVQWGNCINGSEGDEGLLNRVDISADGSSMIVGAKQDDTGALNGGIARVYDFVGGEWIQRGNEFIGVIEDQQQGVVAMSNDGNRIAISSPGLPGGRHGRTNRQNQIQIAFIFELGFTLFPF